MNVLDLVGPMKKNGNKDGGEYQGPCPGCEGTDRFHVWPHQNDGQGSFWCRQCGAAGDIIQFFIDFEGLPYKQAAEKAGREVKDIAPTRPRLKTAPAKPAWQPAPATADPAELWTEKALKFALWSHDNLLDSDETLRYLFDRGINLKSVKNLKLGLNPGNNHKDLFRPREAWGLPTELKANNQKKRLWLPRGLVIPFFKNDLIQRLRIRTTSAKPPYYVIPGSSMDCMMLGSVHPTVRRAAVIVEAELDAALIDQEAGEIVTAIALGNSSRKPDPATAQILDQAAVILVALDADPAGDAATKWWQQVFSQARHWPAPAGKDPGEAYQAGQDLFAWILAGLPRAWRRGQSNNTPLIESSKGEPAPNTPTIKKPSAAVAIPPAVAELARLMDKTPTVIFKTFKKTSIKWPPDWESANWDLSKKISNMVFFEKSVFNYIELHPAIQITGKNLIR